MEGGGGNQVGGSQGIQQRKGQVGQDLLTASCGASGGTSMKPAGVSAMLQGAVLKAKASGTPCAGPDSAMQAVSCPSSGARG